MPPDKRGMAQEWTIRLLTTVMALALVTTDVGAVEREPSQLAATQVTTVESAPTAPLTTDQRTLIDFAVGRFEQQGLVLPPVDFVFHDSLTPCSGHKGMYHRKSRVLEMCSMDPHTLLHELAHAWANENLTISQMEAFVVTRDLDSWNDHDHEWERRGTEHVAETIAWALAEIPRHVKWVETQEDGPQRISHRILTLGIDVETLSENFKMITGQDLVFRDPSEWAPEAVEATSSPELARLGR